MVSIPDGSSADIVNQTTSGKNQLITTNKLTKRTKKSHGLSKYLNGTTKKAEVDDVQETIKR